MYKTSRFFVCEHTGVGYQPAYFCNYNEACITEFLITMPTYEYICNTCGKQFEAFQSMSADAYTHCPENVCEQAEKGKGVVQRKIGAGGGLIFSGSGFYITDYKNNPGSASGSNSGSSSGSKSTPASSSGESSSTSSASSSTSSSTPSAE